MTSTGAQRQNQCVDVSFAKCDRADGISEAARPWWRYGVFHVERGTLPGMYRSSSEEMARLVAVYARTPCRIGNSGVVALKQCVTISRADGSGWESFRT